MTIKKVYTVNGVDYSDLKEAKRANARLVLEKEFGSEIVNKMIKMKGFASMFHALKGEKEVEVEAVVEVAVEAEIASPVVKKPKAAKVIATA
jgi:hypothetical protein